VKIRGVAVAIATAVAVVWGGAAFADAWDADGGPAWQTLLAQAKAEGPIVGSLCPLYAQAMVKGFKADTGIDILPLPGSLTDLASKYRMELKLGRVTTDFRMAGPSDIELAKAGYFADVSANLLLPSVTDPAKWEGGAIRYVDNTRQFMPVPGEYVSGRPVINKDIVAPDALKRWSDLLKPEFDGKIAMFDPTITGAGQSMASYMAKLFGEDFLVKIFAQQHVVISRDAQQLAEWVARGVYPIGLGVDGTYLDNIQQAGMTSVVPITMEDGPGGLVGGCGVLTVPKGAPHLHGAMVFANWYLSQRGQAAVANAIHYPTFRLDVPRDGVRPYFLPQEGVNYADQYTEDWYYGVAKTTRENMKDKLKPYIGD
jgi:iron(III) transport system substrate-binding protein